MKKYVFIFSVLILIIGSVFIVLKYRPQKVVHSSYISDLNFFTDAYAKGEHYKEFAGSHVFGGILPHHVTYAGPLIAGFFEGITHQNIDTVILLSPNHHNAGNYNISTSEGSWTTIFGNLDTDTHKISQLVHDKAAFISEDVFENEHGIYTITSFIKMSFPNAKIIPVVIKAYTSKKDCDALVHSISKLLNDQTIVITSADFSHYLTSEEADAHDKQSLAAIETFNTDSVYDLPDAASVDAPESVYTLMKIMKLENATNAMLIANTNSAKLTNNLKLKSTVSYITMYFTK